MTLGEIIKNFRLSSEEEMSIRRFAALSGLSAPYISLLERDSSIIPTIKTINKVAQVMNVSPVADAPTQVPSRITSTFERAFDEVSDRRAVLPLSLNRLPIISIPISGATEGRSSAITMVTAIGKRIFSRCETTRSCSILI